MLDHLGLAVQDLARAKAFYKAALAPLGLELMLEVPPEQSGSYAYIAFGKLLLDRDSCVGKAFPICGDELLDPLRAAKRLRQGRIVPDVIARRQLVDDIEVSLPGLFEEAADDDFVLFRGHVSPFLGW